MTTTATVTTSKPAWRSWTQNRPWIGSCVAAAIAWAATVATGHGQGAGDLITVALSFSAFTILVSLGQMLVISVGPGNADLSIPSAIALSGAVAMIVMNGENSMIVPGVLAAVAVGMLVGAANFGLIRLLRIPPIIATLAGSLIVMSIAINVGRGLKIKPPPVFADLTTLRLVGIPLIALVALAASLWIALMLQRTLLGRSIEAVGQSERAARLAGIDVQRTRLMVYVICAGLAGLTGALISGFSGGNSLDSGAEYLLLTIAVVVIGGTSVSGGRPCVPGIWGAAMFMFLLVAMLNAAEAGPGLRMLLTGLIIIAVIVLASARKKR
jgi:ribose transport system permease protein